MKWHKNPLEHWNIGMLERTLAGIGSPNFSDWEKYFF